MGLATTSIFVTEYGPPVSVPVDLIDRLGLFEALQELAVNKIIRLSCYGPLVIIQAGKYVGKAMSHHGNFVIEPRYPALFEEMLTTIRRASKSVLADLRVNEDAAANTKLPETAIQRFARLLSECVCQGLPFSYQREIRSSCFPTTGIDVSKTISSLRSRGQSHEAFCFFQSRVLGARFRDLLAEAASVSASSEELSGQLLLNLQLCHRIIGEGSLPSADDCIYAANSLIDDPAYAHLMPLIQAARDVLANTYVSSMVSVDIPSASSDFFVLDQLWEHFLQILLAEFLVLKVQLHPYRGLQTPLLQDGGPNIDPDIAIFRRDTVETVVDAKYTLSTSASAEHVYQMMAYTDCLSAKAGVIVYLSHGSPWKQFVGTTNKGAKLWAAGLSLANASVDVRELLGPLVTSSVTELSYSLN